MDSRHNLERHTRRWVACAISLNVWLAGRVSLAIAATGVAARRATWPPDVPGHRCDPNPAAIYQEGHGDARRGTGLLLAEQSRLSRWLRIPTRRRPSLAQTCRKDRVNCSRAFQWGTP
jgi:hypothetical protein